jgi:hypothetical protein
LTGEVALAYYEVMADFLKDTVGKLKPAVGRRWLLFVGGFVWVCVGAMLLTFSYRWLIDFEASSPLPYVLAGVVLAMVVHHFGFLKIVDRNLGRLLTAEGKKCVFYFMPWRSYLTVAVMVATGIVLRHSPVPKQYLSILYVGIGLGLVLSSVRYFRVLIRQGRR